MSLLYKEESVEPGVLVDTRISVYPVSISSFVVTAFRMRSPAPPDAKARLERNRELRIFKI